MKRYQVARVKTGSVPRGVTLVELLVVIAIIGILAAIILPAVQAARESARKTTCANHLRQLSLATQIHHDAIGHYPAGGWGFRWVGDPDRGFDLYQPGGWIYNTLPYLEQGNLREVGSGAGAAQKTAAVAELIRTPLAVLHCPSRRRSSLYPYLGRAKLSNVQVPAQAAKCDYAGNGGDVPYNNKQGGPASIDDQTVAAFVWPDTRRANGLFYLFSRVPQMQVTDGLSQTYLIGEKHVSTRPHDPHDRDAGDDQTMCLGDDRDIRRWANKPPVRDSRDSFSSQFGSAHSGGCQFAFCDGSVRLVPYTIDPKVHRRLGNRTDGAVIDLGSL